MAIRSREEAAEWLSDFLARKLIAETKAESPEEEQAVDEDSDHNIRSGKLGQAG